MATVSRRQLVRSVAARLASGEASGKVMKELAAYLIDRKQVHQADLFMADIEAELARHGSLMVDVTTARPLDDETRTRVKEYMLRTEKASAVTLREHVDPDIIGGIVIRANGRELDAAVSSQIRQLKTA